MRETRPFPRESARKCAPFWHVCHVLREHACTFMFRKLHRKVRPFPVEMNKSDRTDKTWKHELSRVRETFLRACEKSQNPSPKILEFGIFKNHKNRTFRIFRFSHFFMFGSLFSKMFALAHFHTRVHIFSFPRLLSVQISADSPNSRVKKPQIQVIPHDDTYLSRVTWHVTGAQTCAPENMGCANWDEWVAKSEGSAKLRWIRVRIVGFEKPQTTRFSKMTNPYYFPVLFFVFSFYPNVHFDALFSVPFFPFDLRQLSEFLFSLFSKISDPFIFAFFDFSIFNGQLKA